MKIYGYSALTVIGAALVGYGIFVLVATRGDITRDPLTAAAAIVWSPVVIVGSLMMIAGIYKLL